ILPRGVQVYFRTKILRVDSDENGHHIVTDRGTVHADVIVCTLNAYTPKVFPEYAEIVKPYRSQIAVWAHAPDLLGEALFEGKKGDRYWNQPKVGAYPGYRYLVAGGGLDTPMNDAYDRAPDPTVHRTILDDVYSKFERLRDQ